MAAALGYVARGVELVRTHWRLYAAMTLLYAMPALTAGWLVAVHDERTLWQEVVVGALPWITLVLGTLVVMIAVSAHARGATVSLMQATWRALPYVPRYVWTNVHTTVLFWVPVGLVVWLRERLDPVFTLAGSFADVVGHASWAVVISIAIYLHARTMLAPFLAVHADMPATTAALEAWRLSGRALTLCLTVLLAGSLPVALPVGLVALLVFGTLPVELQVDLERAWPFLVYAAIQAVRPVLIPGAYLLFNDLWTAEKERRAIDGVPPTPLVARFLLELTRSLPSLHHRTGLRTPP